MGHRTGEMANAIAFELRLCAAAGVRKWPTTANVENAADEFERKLTVEVKRMVTQRYSIKRALTTLKQRSRPLFI